MFASEVRVLAVHFIILESDHRELLPVFVAVGGLLEYDHVLRLAVVGLPRMFSTCAFDMPERDLVVVRTASTSTRERVAIASA